MRESFPTLRSACIFATLAFLVSTISARALAVPAVQFETEILSLSLSGSGDLPFPTDTGIQLIPIDLDIVPTPGARHLGRIDAIDAGAGEFAVHGSFDVFFDVTFTGPSGLLLSLPGLSTRVSSDWLATPDALGLFPPLGQHFVGSDTLPGVAIAGGFFDVSYQIDLVFDLGRAVLMPDGYHFSGDASASFTGNITDPRAGPAGAVDFGPFALAGTFELRDQRVPEPATLWIAGLGMLAFAARARSRTRPSR